MARNTSRKNSSLFSRFSGSSYLNSDMLGIASSMFRGRQSAGADKIAYLADATRKLSEDLGDVPSVQKYVEAAANQMEDLSGYVAEHTLEQIVDDGTEFAKRHPWSTAAFAIALGYSFTKLMATDGLDQTNRPSARRTTGKTTSRQMQRKRPATNLKKAKSNGKDTHHAAASTR